jgi:hypothetical protein
LRLFLSLFTHNRFGKHVLPELYYLAGVPLTRLVGRDARSLLSEMASAENPFFLNVFVSTTHPPFGSEYPYYTLWAERNYAGESKFVMAPDGVHLWCEVGEVTADAIGERGP